MLTIPPQVHLFWQETGLADKWSVISVIIRDGENNRSHIGYSWIAEGIGAEKTHAM